ncbi:MAG: endonuclease V [Omnitrophica WOR_2 bacterium]
MNIEVPHRWDVSPDEARQIQESTRLRLETSGDFLLENIHTIAGVDNAYVKNKKGTYAYAVVVLLNYPDLKIIETHYAVQPVSFPYIPGLLFFREAPAVLDACRQLSFAPDVFFFDAHGYAHPRRFGAASHLGVILNKPSIGCAKTRLIGIYQEPGPNFGDYSLLMDRDEVIGAAVRTRLKHSPLFVSIGHRLSLEAAVRIVLACCRENHFLPEPARLAHRLITSYTKPFRKQL